MHPRVPRSDLEIYRDLRALRPRHGGVAINLDVRCLRGRHVVARRRRGVLALCRGLLLQRGRNDGDGERHLRSRLHLPRWLKNKPR
jgi:hypothetical protein